MSRFKLSRLLKSGNRSGREGGQEAAKPPLTEEQISELNEAFDCTSERRRLTAEEVAELNKEFGCCADDSHTADVKDAKRSE